MNLCSLFGTQIEAMETSGLFKDHTSSGAAGLELPIGRLGEAFQYPAERVFDVRRFRRMITSRRFVGWAKPTPYAAVTAAAAHGHNHQ